MKTSFRLLVLAAMAAAQWWAAAAPQPVVHIVDSVLRQVARPEALANVFMRVDYLARCLRRIS
jgi:hypothetical protein